MYDLAGHDPERFEAVFRRWPLADALRAWRRMILLELEELDRYVKLLATIRGAFGGKVKPPATRRLLVAIRRELKGAAPARVKKGSDAERP